MPLNTVTLTWDLADLIQSGITAVISLVPTAVLTDSTDHVVIPEVARSRNFTGGSGSLPGIIACDNSQVTPAGWAYTITVTLANGTVLLSFSAFINFANGATQDLSTLTPVESVTTMQAYLPLPSGTAQAGNVPVATGTGNATAWGSGGGGMTNPMTTLGDMIDGGAAGAPARLAGNTAATRKFLRSAGTGTAATAPAWDTLQAGDLPAATSGALGAVELAGDLAGTAASPQVTGTHLASPLPVAQGGTGAATLTGLVKGNGTSAFTAAAAGTDYLAPAGNGSALTGLTESQIAGLVSDLAARALLSGATFTGYLAPAVSALTFGASIAVNAALGNVFTVTLTSSAGTIQNPTNPVDGQIIRFRITQDATGSRTVAWGTAYDFGAAGAPSLTTTAGKTDILAFEYVATGSLNKWCYLGAAVPQGF